MGGTSAVDLLTWAGIAFCVSQSAMFSGLNLAVFSISRIRLEVEATAGNRDAGRLLDMRADGNFLLTTILWGNVGINVLLTLLSNSVMAGIAAFLFSTFVITFAGEILPQAYFSRNAIRMAALLAPVLNLYKVVLYPVAKPSALVLDGWLGAEGIQYFRERDLREVIRLHMEADATDVDSVEGTGAINFLAIDDLVIGEEGEVVDPRSILSLPVQDGRPVFPAFELSRDDPFVRQVAQSGRKWVILTDPDENPLLVMDADEFLRRVFLRTPPCNPYAHCHRPVVIKDRRVRLGQVFTQLKYRPKRAGDDVIDQDIILFWGRQRRVITGADILGRLMRGIAHPLKS